MDEQVKARLIGATVLVVVAVLLVPELLSGPKPGSDEATAKGKRGTRTYTIDLGAAAGEAARLEPAAPAADATRRPATTTLPTVAPPGVAAEKGGDTIESAPASVPVAAASTAAASRPAALATAPTTTAPGATTTTPARVAAPVSSAMTAAQTPSSSSTQAAKTSSAPIAATPPPTKGGWAVQVGAFSSADAARKVVTDLGRDGYTVYVAPLNRGGKTLYRVRVGPVAARPDAEKLANRLKASGKSGAVVAAD